MRTRKLVGVALAAGFAAALTAVTALPAASAPAAAPAKDPVVIMPGMIGSGPITALSYIPLELKLESQGYDTSIFTTPNYGLGDIHGNAERLDTFVDDVLARTGATKVDLVAHSQGGLISRDYIETLGGDAHVDNLIMMGTPNNGTVLANLANFFLIDCVGLTGCAQQAIGSDYLNALNAGDDTIGSVDYTSISTKFEEVVIPYTSAFMDTADGNVTNITVQDQCWFRFPEHLAIIANGAVIDGVLDALRDAPVRMNCWAVI